MHSRDEACEKVEIDTSFGRYESTGCRCEGDIKIRLEERRRMNVDYINFGSRKESVDGLLPCKQPTYKKKELCVKLVRLCGLVVRVSGYRYRGLGFDSRPYQIF